jgi:hypothetical protein
VNITIIRQGIEVKTFELCDDVRVLSVPDGLKVNLKLLITLCTAQLPNDLVMIVVCLTDAPYSRNYYHSSVTSRYFSLEMVA